MVHVEPASSIDTIGGNMRERFLEYAKRGAMTKEELAEVLNFTVSKVETLVRQKIIPKVPHSKPATFDPAEMLRIFCEPSKQVRSVTTEKRSNGGNPKPGGFRKCL